MRNFILTMTQVVNDERICKYTIGIRGSDSVFRAVYSGKFYVAPNQQFVTLNIEDVLKPYLFVGQDVIEPYKLLSDDYWCVHTYTGLFRYFYSNDVRINGPDFGQVTRRICFANYDALGGAIQQTNNITVPLLASYQPTPMVPEADVEGFAFKQLINNYVVAMPDDDEWVYNDQLIAKLDHCPTRYYLVWMTNMGGTQCQRFTLASEQEYEYSRTMRTDPNDYRWGVGNTSTLKMKMKSENLSDADFEAYCEMLNSKWVILLDTKFNRMYYVNITDSNASVKNRYNSNQKKGYFEVNIESAERHINF